MEVKDVNKPNENVSPPESSGIDDKQQLKAESVDGKEADGVIKHDEPVKKDVIEKVVDNEEDSIESPLLKEKEAIDRGVKLPDEIKGGKSSESEHKDEEKVDDENSKKEAWSWKGLSSWGTSVINEAASSVTTFTTQVGDGLIQVLETVESGLLTQNDSVNTFEQEAKKDSEEKEPITDQHGIDPKIEPKTVNDDKDNKDDGKIISKAGVAIEEEDKAEEGKSLTSSLWSGLTNVVSKTTSVVQKTTNVVVHGGLDVLETIGKKTYDVLTEGDHGLKEVIKKNRENKQMPDLSLALKEAREISEMKAKEEESLLESKKYLYGYWFDEYQGLVQLEAFELLGRENELKTREFYDSVDKEKLEAVKKKLADLNKIFKKADKNGDGVDDDDEEEDGGGSKDDDDDVVDHDFHQLLLDYASKLPVVVNVQKLLECQEETRKWLVANEKTDGLRTEDAKEILKKSMQCLAKLTASSIQHFHKLAQLLLRSLEIDLQSSSTSPSSPSSPSSSNVPLAAVAFANVSVLETASIIVGFSKALREEITIESTKFVAILASYNSYAAEEATTATTTTAATITTTDDFITTVYLEAGNSCNFVRKCLKLLLPALQIAVIRVD